MPGRLVKLPDPTFRVPREKPLPNKEKVMTRRVVASPRFQDCAGWRASVSSLSFAHRRLRSHRWEKFAEEKGIKKRKRSKMVYDEAQQEWRRAREGENRLVHTRRL